MALVRIYQKPAGTPANGSVFAIEVLQNNIWYTRKVSWEALKGLIAGAESLVLDDGKLVFTTPDGVAHEVLTVEDEVLAGSDNPVSSGAVSSALNGKQDVLTFDQVPTDGSTNPVESNGIYDALAGKQDTLTFDTAPTDGSTNPVTSAGIYTAISAITTGIDWKESVPTYADIATTYPNPQDGWTVTTLDDDRTYRYNGTAWVDLFSLITLATAQKDGLMSSTDFSKLAGIEAQANRTIVDDALSTSSTNPVQNKVITGKLNTLLDVTETTFTNPYTKKLVPSGQYTEKLKKLIGASVVWNQLVNGNTNFGAFHSSVSYDSTTNEFTVTADTNYVSGGLYNTTLARTIPTGHKILISADIKGDSVYSFRIYLNHILKSFASTTSYKNYSVVYNTEEADELDFYITYASAERVMNIKNIQLFDLTAMFGSTIANYVYTLEGGTAGSGVAWLQSYGFFTEDYYAYSANTIQSVSVSGKKNVGKNLLKLTGRTIVTSATTSSATPRDFDKPYAYIGITMNNYFNNQQIISYSINEDSITVKSNSSGYGIGLNISVEPNKQYAINYSIFTNNYVGVGFYDKNGNYLSYKHIIGDNHRIFTTPANCYNAIVVFRPDANTNFTFSKCQLEIGDTITDYSPYIEPTIYPLDHTELRGLFKLDANNNLYADGDIYNADGSGDAKYAEISDWSTISITQNQSTASTYEVIVVLSNKKYGYDNFICYPLEYKAWADDGTYGIRGYSSSGNVAIRFPVSVVSSVAQARQWLTNNSAVLIYELETPTTQSLTPYTSLQNIESGGTEEFVDYGVEQGTRDVAIPVGNESVYGDNENMGKIINYMQS